jgi:hypothetical protein
MTLAVTSLLMLILNFQPARSTSPFLHYTIDCLPSAPTTSGLATSFSVDARATTPPSVRTFNC